MKWKPELFSLHPCHRKIARKAGRSHKHELKTRIRRPNKKFLGKGSRNGTLPSLRSSLPSLCNKIMEMFTNFPQEKLMLFTLTTLVRFIVGWRLLFVKSKFTNLTEATFYEASTAVLTTIAPIFHLSLSSICGCKHSSSLL